MKKPIYGIMTMVPTVFDKKGDLDIEGFKENLRYLEDNGMHGIITTASCGEYYQLNGDEYDKVVDAAVDACKKMTCVCGSHHHNMRECIRRTKYAENAGADGVMILPSYYASWLNKDACYNFYKLLHDATSEIQIMIYNYEPGSGFNMTPDLFETLLRDFDRITTVKECSNVWQMAELIRRCGDRINVLAGAEWALLQGMFLGGKGAVAMWGAAIPRFLLDFYETCKNQNWDKALQFHQKLVKHVYEGEKDPSLQVYNIKPIAEETGRKAGPRRAPFSPTTTVMRKFHGEWLKEIGVIT